ncbi:MAG TPA: D-alanyl-D-alanine dipeptidase [Pirellulaceae bacterium]
MIVTTRTSVETRATTSAWLLLSSCVWFSEGLPSVGQGAERVISRVVPVGSSRVEWVTRTWGTSPYVCCNMHDDENTSVKAACHVLSRRGGRLEELRHTGRRHVLFQLGERRFEFDPNRVFTPRGVRATLTEFSEDDPEARRVVEEFGQRLWKRYRATGVLAIVSLHNNLDRGFAATSYLPGGDLGREAADLSLRPESDPDDFFFVTDRRLFEILSQSPWAVVQQDNQRASDDGSLSIQCAAAGIPYINVEAEVGHFVSQVAMLTAALDALDNVLKPARQATRLSEADVELVDLSQFDPTLVIDARYATDQNVTGKPLYPRNALFLERSAAERLRRVQSSLRRQGLGLKVLDAYRPLSVQKKLWAVKPDPRYVADPAQGSRHNRGAAVDVTLVDAKGRELPMPTQFDDFSDKAHRDYQDLPPEVIHHRELLEQAMRAEQFEPLPTEWWHFDAPGWEQFPVMNRDPYRSDSVKR